MDDKLNEVCQDVAVLKSEHKTLKDCYIEVAADVKEIKDKLLARPSWIILTIISILTTVCSSLAVYIIVK